MHYHRVRKKYLAVLLELTGNLEEQWQGQGCIAAVEVWVRHVLRER